MKTMKKCSFMLLLFICLCGACNSGNAQKNEQTTHTEKTDSLQPLQLPEIPVMYTTPQQKAEFIITHYWDNFNFTDTTYINKPEITEQAYADFLYIAGQTPLNISAEGIRNMMQSAGKEKRMYNYFIELADKYLYDPNSPFRNEELYIVVLQSMIESPLLSDVEKSRPNFRLNMAMKNRIGEKANNFTYVQKSGKSGSLYQTPTEYTLIFFNNPGCHACAETIEELKMSQIINALLGQKRITILAIYPDEELDEWNEHLKDFPTQWVNGYNKDGALREKELYDLKAIPTLYLLDKQKNVLLKDTTLPVIEALLSTRAQ